jgi:ABC-type dipeptide/oligopeptide/nickel transport system permease component
MGATLFFAFLTMFGNLLADILYSIADPRIAHKG